MKIAILTQALLDNYGGLLQNYALQQCLKKIGHSPYTVDFCQMTNTYRNIPRVLGSWGKTIFLRIFMRQKRKFARFYQPKKRMLFSEQFVLKYIDVTDKVTCYSPIFFKQNLFDAIIVGSDQVWRPKYNVNIEDMFLGFAQELSLKRVSYAASFGVDEWEYSKRQTEKCSSLVKKFDAISVREKTGVDLCRDYLCVDSQWVLDPTLLLDKSDYLNLCKDVQVCSEKYLAAYVLGMNEEIEINCKKIAKEKGLILKVFSADSNASLTIPEWLAMFRDASYVVTDSFHGTVFSIIFGKEFKCIYNETRGAARFESLLNLYNSGKIEEMRQFSLDWLKRALES